MHPVFITFGDVVISSYSVTMLIGFLLGFALMGPAFRRKGLEDELRDYVLLASVMGGIGGAKLLFLFENITLGQFLDDPLRFLASGLTFLGGLIGATCLIWVVTYLKKVSFIRVIDALSPIIFIGYALGRLGCFLVGDDYGTPTDLPWGMSFPLGSPPTNESVHPAQIYDIILLTTIFSIMWRLSRKESPNGWLTGIMLVVMGSERFLIEFIRTTTPSFIPGITVAQLMSLGIVVLGVAVLLVVRGTFSSQKPGLD